MRPCSPNQDSTENTETDYQFAAAPKNGRVAPTKIRQRILKPPCVSIPGLLDVGSPNQDSTENTETVYVA